jgi:single-strand DNA-binding protein
MSEGMNRVILLGYLGSDPELRFTNSGTPLLSWRMATHESYMDRNKQVQDRTEWHNVILWGPRAEGLSKVLVKGSCVAVEGGLRTQTVERDGVKRYFTEVHARDVYLTGRQPDEPRDSAAATVTTPAQRHRARTLPTGTDPVIHEELPY